MCAAQGIEFRAPLKTSPTLQRCMAVTRQTIPTLVQDRYLANDIDAASALVADGTLADTAGISGYVTGQTL